MSVFNEAEYQAAEVVSTSQNAVQIIAQIDKPQTCVKKAKAPPPAAIRTVSVLPDSHWRNHYLDVCHGDHNAAEVLGKIAFRYQPKSNGTPRLENDRYTRDGQRAYWWGHKVETLASECGLKYEQTRYALRKLTAWGLIETRSAKTPVKMLQIRLLIAEGAGSLNGWPDFSNSQIAICENSQKAICENSQMKSFKGVGSKVEGSKDFVDASLSTEPVPANSSMQTGKINPKVKPEHVTPDKPRGLWETLMKEFHPEQAVRVPGENKMLRDLRKDLDAQTDLPDSMVVVRFLIERWYKWAPSGVNPKPQYLTSHRGMALEYFRKFYVSPEQAAADAAKKVADHAKWEAEAEAAKAQKAAAPKKKTTFQMTPEQRVEWEKTLKPNPMVCYEQPPAPAEPAVCPVIVQVKEATPLHVLDPDDFEDCNEPPDDYPKAEKSSTELKIEDFAKQKAKQLAKAQATGANMFKPKQKPAIAAAA